MQHTVRFNLTIKARGASCTPPVPVLASTCYVHDVLPSDRRLRPCTLRRYNPTETGSPNRPPHHFAAAPRLTDSLYSEGLAVRFTESRHRFRHLNRAPVNHALHIVRRQSWSNTSHSDLCIKRPRPKPAGLVHYADQCACRPALVRPKPNRNNTLQGAKSVPSRR
jgi:hypothetical protein